MKSPREYDEGRNEENTMVYTYEVVRDGLILGDVTGRSLNDVLYKAILWYGKGCTLVFVSIWDGEKFIYTEPISVF